MIKHQILLPAILITAGLAFSSCDNFLTQMPEHELTIGNAVRDYASAKQLVNGMYATYEYSSKLGGDISSYLNSQASLWKYNVSHVNMAYRQSNTDTDDVWQDLYVCINAANAAISSIGKAPDHLFPSAEEKARLLAEARCFRGFMNLQLLWYYGHWFGESDSPYGIIYRDEVSELSNLMLPRSTVGQSYRYILDDLIYAEEHAADYESSVYLSRQFARALHAKLLLNRGWEGDYTEALALVESVLSSPGAAKIEPDITKLYADAWDSRELLFAQNKIDIISQSSSNHDSAGWSDYVWAGGLYGQEYTEIPYGWLKDDPRYPHIFSMAYGPEQWQVTQGEKKLTLTKLYHGGRIMEPNAKYCTYVLRLTELYIMKAELLARTRPGDLAGALAPINEYRARYTKPVLPALPVPSSRQALLNTIFREYTVALFMENEAVWMASIRIPADGGTWLKKLKGNEVNYSQNQYCWPIPNDEIIAHVNPIEQNPGLE